MKTSKFLIKISSRKASTSNATIGKPPYPQKYLLDRALSPFIAKNPIDLSNHLSKNVIYHAVGDIIAVEKPYGVSCLGYIQKGHGVFGHSREQHAEREDDPEYNKRRVLEPTLNDALPILKERFQEPGLHFCIGLRRWVSGPVVLPCTSTAFKRIIHSTGEANSLAHTTKEWEAQHMYRALAICVSKPVKDSGTVYGYATHQDTGKAVEYLFTEGEIKKRARKGKFAVQGEISYKVLESNYGLSLVDLHFTKFSMHFPRLFLSYLCSPILGDQIYMRRLLEIDGHPVLVEPKDLPRGGNKYEPAEFLRLIGLNRIEELKPALPIFLAVYQTVYPTYGDTPSERKMTELRLRTPPPEHFLAIAELLKFKSAIKRLLNSLEEGEEEIDQNQKKEKSKGTKLGDKEQKEQTRRESAKKHVIIGGDRKF